MTCDWDGSEDTVDACSCAGERFTLDEVVTELGIDE